MVKWTDHMKHVIYNYWIHIRMVKHSKEMHQRDGSVDNVDLSTKVKKRQKDVQLVVIQKHFLKE